MTTFGQRKWRPRVAFWVLSIHVIVQAGQVSNVDFLLFYLELARPHELMLSICDISLHGANPPLRAVAEELWEESHLLRRTVTLKPMIVQGPGRRLTWLMW